MSILGSNIETAFKELSFSKVPLCKSNTNKCYADSETVIHYLPLPSVVKDLQYPDPETGELIGGNILVLSRRATEAVLAKEVKISQLEIHEGGWAFMPATRTEVDAKAYEW